MMAHDSMRGLMLVSECRLVPSSMTVHREGVVTDNCNPIFKRQRSGG